MVSHVQEDLYQADKEPRTMRLINITIIKNKEQNRSKLISKIRKYSSRVDLL